MTDEKYDWIKENGPPEDLRPVGAEDLRHGVDTDLLIDTMPVELAVALCAKLAAPAPLPIREVYFRDRKLDVLYRKFEVTAYDGGRQRRVWTDTEDDAQWVLDQADGRWSADA